MIKRNKNIEKLPSSYLFWEINRRRKEFCEKNRNVKIINLSIGNTTEPITPYVVKKMSDFTISMGTKEGYTGYGEFEGMPLLRKRISDVFYNGKFDISEIFISDGSKSDIARLQVLFGSDVTVAVQNPYYPPYVDGSVIIGRAGEFNKEKIRYDGIVYMDCTVENNFFPDLSKIKRSDIIYFCSPNNPTGAIADREQLKRLVDFARKNSSVIVFDGAYSQFIRDNRYPKSIYEIDGAEEVAIEVSSFSKIAGFTGIRLGWTVIPSALKYSDGSSVKRDFGRVISTTFNGPSVISQNGGLAVLDEEGQKETERLIDYYLENSRIIKDVFVKAGFEVYGGYCSPYIWVKLADKTSWDIFDEVLEKCYVVTTPGSGFGSRGEGFIRMSGFGQREDVIEAGERIKRNFTN